jgi:hypothetical protein
VRGGEDRSKAIPFHAHSAKGTILGLTIHYTVRSSTRSPKIARSLIEQLRQRALDLPVQGVGPLVEFSGADCVYNQQSKDDPNRWLLIQSGEFIRRGDHHYPVAAKRVIAFSVDVGDGCEPANFGLCLYPSVIEWHGERLRTGLSGWRWSSFCKTQYASNPDFGGVSHFLRCHLSVVAMLDFAKNLNILTDVSDEGCYFTKRDVKALAQEVGEWNELIASGAGKPNRRRLASSNHRLPRFRAS